MVYERILFVYGTLFPRKEIIETIKKLQGEEDISFEDEDKAREYELELLELFDEDVNIYEYKCCSKLSEKYVVVGKEIPSAPTPKTILNTVVTISSYLATPEFKNSVQTDVYKLFGNRNYDTYVMLDDCTFCS